MLFGMSLEQAVSVVWWYEVLLDPDLLHYKNVDTDDERHQQRPLPQNRASKKFALVMWWTSKINSEKVNKSGWVRFNSTSVARDGKRVLPAR